MQYVQVFNGQCWVTVFQDTNLTACCSVAENRNEKQVRIQDDKLQVLWERGGKTEKVFEQGALDSLYAAKQALDQAIHEYEVHAKNWTIPLSMDSGPLFATNDYLDMVVEEVQAFRNIANK